MNQKNVEEDKIIGGETEEEEEEEEEEYDLEERK